MSLESEQSDVTLLAQGLSEAPAPIGEAAQPLTDQDRIVTLLDYIWERMIEQEGRSPNFLVREFDLLTTARETISADWNPDRWVVYFRQEANATVRIFPGARVPAEGAIELEDGRYAVIANVGNVLSFHNTGSATAHIFAVAVGGGAEFEIGALSL